MNKNVKEQLTEAREMIKQRIADLELRATVEEIQVQIKEGNIEVVFSLLTDARLICAKLVSTEVIEEALGETVEKLEEKIEKIEKKEAKPEPTKPPWKEKERPAKPEPTKPKEEEPKQKEPAQVNYDKQPPLYCVRCIHRGLKEKKGYCFKIKGECNPKDEGCSKKGEEAKPTAKEEPVIIKEAVPVAKEWPVFPPEGKHPSTFRVHTETDLVELNIACQYCDDKTCKDCLKWNQKDYRRILPLKCSSCEAWEDTADQGPFCNLKKLPVHDAATTCDRQGEDPPDQDAPPTTKVEDEQTMTEKEKNKRIKSVQNFLNKRFKEQRAEGIAPKEIYEKLAEEFPDAYRYSGSMLIIQDKAQEGKVFFSRGKLKTEA